MSGQARGLIRCAVAFLLLVAVCDGYDNSDEKVKKASFKQKRSDILLQQAKDERRSSQVALQQAHFDNTQATALMTKAVKMMAKIAALKVRDANKQQAGQELSEVPATLSAAREEQQHIEHHHQGNRIEQHEWVRMAKDLARVNRDRQLADDKLEDGSDERRDRHRDDRNVRSEERMLARDMQDAEKSGIINDDSTEGREYMSRERARRHKTDTARLVSLVRGIFQKEVYRERKLIDSELHSVTAARPGPPGPPGPPGSAGPAVTLPPDAATPIVV